jgi:hypothetical protein
VGLLTRLFYLLCLRSKHDEIWNSARRESSLTRLVSEVSSLTSSLRRASAVSSTVYKPSLLPYLSTSPPNPTQQNPRHKQNAHSRTDIHIHTHGHGRRPRRPFLTSPNRPDRPNTPHNRRANPLHLPSFPSRRLSSGLPSKPIHPIHPNGRSASSRSTRLAHQPRNPHTNHAPQVPRPRQRTTPVRRGERAVLRRRARFFSLAVHLPVHLAVYRFSISVSVYRRQRRGRHGRRRDGERE